MKTTLLAILATVAILGTACDIVEAPYLKNPIGPVDTTKNDTSTTMVRSGGVQNVLLEDYTGHTCGNCPEAADIATSIATKNPGRVIVMAVHVGVFAVPEFPDYPADYRTAVGNTLDETFLNSRAGLPNGLVNRVRYNNRLVLGRQNWEPATNVQLAKTPKLDLGLSHTHYKEDSLIVASVEATYLEAGETDYSIVVYLVENGIVGDQKDYRRNPEHVEDYEFEHVLRASLNGTWGDTLSKNAEAAGTKLTKTFRYKVPAGVPWKLENCELIAFVIRRTTNEVVQVVKQKIKA